MLLKYTNMKYFKLSSICVLLILFAVIVKGSTNSPYIDSNPNDLALVGNIDDDSNDELILINRTYNSGAVRAIDLVSGDNQLWINHGELETWLDETDKAFLGDINNDKKKELILVNTDYQGGAIKIIDMTSGIDLLTFHHTQYSFLTWMDSNDKMFVADVDGNNIDDLILINMDNVNGFILVTNLLTGQPIKTINYSAFQGMNGWIDPTDKMFLGYVNSGKYLDIVFLNTNYNSGAIRAIEIMTSSQLKWINHGTFGSWMDVTDRIFFGDINNDLIDELIFVNTNYVGEALMTYDIMDERKIKTFQHGNYSGWMDPCDRMFLSDINGDGKNDIVFVNTTLNSGAVRGVDLNTGENLGWIMHSYFDDWMDETDKMMMIKQDSRGKLLMINTAIRLESIRVTDVPSTSGIAFLTNEIYPSLYGWLDGQDINSNLCIDNSNPQDWVNPFVELKNNKFYLCGAPWFPKVINYKVYLCSPNGHDFWISPYHLYYNSNNGELYPISKAEATEDIRNHLSDIVRMGFNTIRLCLGSAPYGDDTLPGNTDLFYKYEDPYTLSHIRNKFINCSNQIGPINDFLKLAKAAGLKVILLANGTNIDGEIESKSIATYLSELSNFLKNDPTIMAYDLYNEPSDQPNNKYEHPKNINCSYVDLWYNAIRLNTPHQLVTIGSRDFPDVVFNWDPNMLNVDFLSFHMYPMQPDNGILKRNFYWIKNNLHTPWIIGETGYQGYNGDDDCKLPASPFPFQTEADQYNFIESNYKQAIGAGAIGYSIWWYRDSKPHHQYPWWLPNQGYFFGLKTNCNRFKPAASLFRRDGFDIEGEETTKPLYYYNLVNSGSFYQFKGRVLDEKLNPIKDAVIYVQNENWTNNTFTFSDENGYFNCHVLPLSLAHYRISSTMKKLISNQSSLFVNGVLDIGDIILESVTCITNKQNIVKLEEQTNINTQVFPNPTDGYIHLPSYLNGRQFTIHTINGFLIHKGKIANNEINVESLIRGMYLLQIAEYDEVLKFTKM